MFRKVAIIGVGLIGGSLGMVLKKKRIADEVVGVCRHDASIHKAVVAGAIDSGDTSLNVIKGADCVILAAPVKTIISQAAAIAKIAGRDCLVTDVGSTKVAITASLESVFPRFVGAHPLAGSEKRGVEFASAILFEKSLCILTPTSKTPAEAADTVSHMWRHAGCTIVRMPPARHDEIVAEVSHLPHAVAFALINAVSPRYAGFAASGLKDTTRIAASDEHIWADILLSNRGNVVKAAKSFEQDFRRIISAVKQNDASTLRSLIRKARVQRIKIG